MRLLDCAASSFGGPRMRTRYRSAAARSERRLRLLQEFRFFRRRYPAQCRIAVGEAAEAPDDLLMAQDIGEVVIGLGALLRRGVLDPLPKQREGAGLVHQVFAMLEGRSEEHT